MALYSPSQIRQSKKPKPQADVETLAQELVRNLQMGLPNLSPEELQRPQLPFGQPQIQESSLSGSESVYSGQMPTLSVPQQGGFVAGGGSGFSSDDMTSSGAPMPTTGGNQPSDSLGFLPDPRGAAGDRFTKAVAALQQRIKEDPNFQYGNYEGIAKPTRKDTGLALPQLTQDTFNKVTSPSLDAALLASGIGTLLGTPGFGTRAGMNLLGGALGQSQKQDKELYSTAMSQYEDANRTADRTYSQDVDRYGMDIRSVDARNNDITRRINNEQDALQATYGVEQRAETAQEALVARKNKDNLKVKLDLLKDGRMKPEDQEKLSQMINKELGTSLSGIWDELDPYQKAKLSEMRLTREQRNKLHAETLAAKAANIEAIQSAIKERLDRTIAYQIDRDTKANKLKGEVAQLASDAKAFLARFKGSPSDKTQYTLSLKQLNDNVAKAQTVLNRQTTALKESTNRLQSAQMSAAKIYLKPEMIDPSYVDPKDPQMNGLNEAGRSAMRQFLKVIKDQEGGSGGNSPLSSHVSIENEYIVARQKYNDEVKALKDFLSRPQTSESVSADAGVLPALVIGDAPRLGTPLNTAVPPKAPPAKPKSKLEAALDAAGFGKK